MSLARDLFARFLDHRRIEGDDENNAILDAIIDALADVFDPMVLIGLGDEEAGVEGGGRVLRDPSVAPLDLLPHAALYTGARLPARLPGESDDDFLARARPAAVYPLGILRGTHRAVKRAIEPYLTGTRTVFVSDNYGGPYDLFVRTLIEETPDSAAVRAALEGDFVSGGRQGAIRAELILHYVTSDYVTWAEPTVRWADVPDVSWRDVTREDVT